MKRLLHFQFLLVLLLALGYSPLQAKRITQWQAQQQAYSFWGKQMPQKAKAKSRAATTASRSDAYYVFNNDAGGFVIIAGDDAVTPVLGYTSTGSFDAENLPDGLKDLLKSYERQIAALGDSYQANQTATRAGFTGEKLLKTAEWNQTAPFNKYTPNNYVTGCVATAGAIVMKHHGYPAKGTGSHSYTWNGKTLTANFEHDYDWANMPAKYDGTNDAAFDGVARLMSDLGVAVEMQYAKSGSAAYIGNLITALQTYFSYSKLTYLASIDDVGAEAWNAKLRGEIDGNRPILYSASDASSGGHSFIIDGYKDESFSVNWGWGGYCNGFYQIGALNPENAGKPMGDKYNLGQTAVIGLQPSDGTEKVSTMGFYRYNNLMQVLNMNVTDVKKGQRCAIFSAPIGNTGDHIGNIHIQCLQFTGNFQESHRRYFLRTIRRLHAEYCRLTYIILIARWLSFALWIQGSNLVETVTIAAPAPVYTEAFVLVSINYEGVTATSIRVRSSIEHRAVGINLVAQSAVPSLCTHILYCHQMRKLAVAEILLQGGYQVADIRTASILIILHLHSHTEVCHQSCHAVEGSIVAVILCRHVCPIITELEIGSQGLAVPGIGMASGALSRVSVMLHYNGTSRCHTANRIVVWRVLVERIVLVPFRSIEQFFACKCCSCGCLIRLIAVAQRRNLALIALQQVLQTVRQILGIK